MARTMLIGLRRDPPPPMPIVMPSRSSATTSSTDMRLWLTLLLLRSVGVALVDERVAELIRHAGQVELEGEPLLEAIGTLDVPEVDAVEALFGGAHDCR